MKTFKIQKAVTSVTARAVITYSTLFAWKLKRIFKALLTLAT